MSGDIFDLPTQGGGNATCFQWVEKQEMLLNILQCIGQPPTAKNYPVLNVSSATVEKCWPRLLSKNVL